MIKSNLVNDEQHRTLSITLIGKLELIIEGETSLKLSNMCKIHNVALKNNLDTRCDFKACSLHIVNSQGLEIVSFYTGFTRLVMEY